MNIDRGLRRLRAMSLAVTVLSLLLLIAGLAQLVAGGFAVSAHYDLVAERLASARELFPYSAQEPQTVEYQQSSGAFLAEMAMSAGDPMGWLESPFAIATAMLLVVALVFLGVAMLWVWRAHANLRDAGIRAKFTPQRALAAYLLPVANLVVPFEAMRELYNRSHGEPEELVDSSVDDVTAWWTAVAIGLLIFSVVLVKMTIDVGSELIIMTPLWMEFVLFAFAVSLLLVAGVLFAGLVRTITRAQTEYLPTVDPADHLGEFEERPRVRIVG